MLVVHQPTAHVILPPSSFIRHHARHTACFPAEGMNEPMRFSLMNELRYPEAGAHQAISYQLSLHQPSSAIISTRGNTPPQLPAAVRFTHPPSTHHIE